MTSILWKLLMWLWVRRATKRYGGPGEQGELFNTACFQSAVGATTGQSIGEQTVRVWLVECGYFRGHGGCHWYKGQRAAAHSLGR